MVTRKGTVLLMAKPFFPWMGNKEKLVPYIHQLIPPHVKQFTEVFGGSGAVILGLQPKKGRLDIYNDLNDDLFNVFCCVKEKSFSLAKELKFLFLPQSFYQLLKVLDMDAQRPSQLPAAFPVFTAMTGSFQIVQQLFFSHKCLPFRTRFTEKGCKKRRGRFVPFGKTAPSLIRGYYMVISGSCSGWLYS